LSLQQLNSKTADASKTSLASRMKKEDIDYSLYLVTDSTPAILGQRDLDHVVESALRGGITCVQYRDKTADTGKLISVARSLLERTRRAGVPLLINDRVDVALAVGCEGVHIGQDDMGLCRIRTSVVFLVLSSARRHIAIDQS
jgi:thiamine-phosphate diphosphorylase / hydroxyethylthiazole kinase